MDNTNRAWIFPPRSDSPPEHSGRNSINDDRSLDAGIGKERVARRGWERAALCAGTLLLLCCAAACSSTKSEKGGAAGGSSGIGPGGMRENDLNRLRENRFGEGGIPTAEGEGMFRDIHFEFDSATVSDTSRADLEYNAQVLKQQSGLRVELEGHTDERGTNEYNLALGARRARAVLDGLVSYGIEPGRVSTISYGEELPLASGSDESAFAENRRVHFSPFTGGGGGGTGAAPSGGSGALRGADTGRVGSDYNF